MLRDCRHLTNSLKGFVIVVATGADSETSFAKYFGQELMRKSAGELASTESR